MAKDRVEFCLKDYDLEGTILAICKGQALGGSEFHHMVITMKKWLNITPSVENNDETLGYFGLLNKSYDLMQDRMCLMSILHHKPDYVVNISRQSSSTYEFYRAKDMIEEGRKACSKALEKREEYFD